MKNRSLAMILVLSLAMNAAVLAVVGYRTYGSSKQTTPAAGCLTERDYHFYEVLSLTPAQLEKMTPMAAAFHERLKRLHSQMEDKNNIMIDLLEGEGIAPARIEALRKEMAALQDSIQQTVIAHVLEVKDILNSNQRKRFFDLLRRSMGRQHGMFAMAGEK